MEWFILAVAVPLLLVPLVLLFGFSGCGLDAVGSAPLPLATKLTAKAVFVGNENRIILAWIGDKNAARYQLLRGEEGQPLLPIPTVADITATMFTDSPATGLSREGTTFVYRVRAITLGGIPGSLSNEAKTTTLPAAPVLRNAIPTSPTGITLNWTRVSTKGTLMYIERQQLPAAGGWVFRNTTTDPNSFPDGVPSGSTWEYRVFDSVKGFDDSIEKQVLSPPSNVVQAQPLP